jgi:hypothetical protein
MNDALFLLFNLTVSTRVLNYTSRMRHFASRSQRNHGSGTLPTPHPHVFVAVGSEKIYVFPSRRAFYVIPMLRSSSIIHTY